MRPSTLSAFCTNIGNHCLHLNFLCSMGEFDYKISEISSSILYIWDKRRIVIRQRSISRVIGDIHQIWGLHERLTHMGDDFSGAQIAFSILTSTLVVFRFTSFSKTFPSLPLPTRIRKFKHIYKQRLKQHQCLEDFFPLWKTKVPLYT